MKLVAPGRVQDAMGVGDVGRVLNAIGEALEQATSVLSHAFRTPFDRASVVDLFWVYPDDSRVVGDAARNRARALTFQGLQEPAVQTSVRLSRGFVTAAPVAVRAATTIPHLTTAGEYEDLQAHAGATVHADREAGTLQVHGFDLEHAYVRVEYEAGFEAQAEAPDQYVVAQVPDWLQDAAILQARLVLASHPALEDAQIEETPESIKRLRSMLHSVVDQHVRYRPKHVKPFHTEVA